MENPNEVALKIMKEYLQEKSYDFIVTTARHITEIAGTICKLPILKEEN